MATPTPIKQNEEEPTFHKPKVHLCFRFGPLVDPIFQVYFLLSLAQVVLYAETGAVPALLVELTQDFNLSFTEQGYLGGMVYAGIAVGAPFTSGLVTCFEPRTVLIWSMAINACVTILFGFTPQYYSKMLISIRFFIGLTQATLSCYCPVWVGRFATKGNQGKWFALLQITIPLGKYIKRKYIKAKWSDTRMDVSISIPSPSFKPVSLSLTRIFSYSKTPKQVYFFLTQ